MSLSNCHPDMNPLVGIALTNMIPVTRAGARMAVFRSVSRINHSCVPSCSHHQVSEHGGSHVAREEIRAVRTITPGEELTISYRNQLQEKFITTYDRKKHLQEVIFCHKLSIMSEKMF